MGIFEIIGGVLLLLVSIVIVVCVTLQEQKGNGVNALGSSSESYLDKNKTVTNEATLATITKYAGIALFVVTLGILALSVYVK